MFLVLSVNILFCTAYVYGTPTSTPSTTPKHIRCDYQYFDEAGGWLKYHKFPARWTEAMDICYQEGAVLASPTTLTSGSMMCLMKNQKAKNIFTGINDLISTGIFNTLEGGPAEEDNVPHQWADDEPNNANENERCVKLDRLGLLADVECSLKLPYICYRKKTDIDNERRCNTFNDGYSYNNKTRSCHKVYSTKQTYEKAFKTCYMNGGYLAIINNEDERQFIKQLITNEIPANQKPEDEYNMYLAHFIGFHDFILKKGVFRTVKGQTLEESGFAKFETGEPNNKNGNEYCGSLIRDLGRDGLNDMDCSHETGFVCEIDVKESC